MMGMSGVVCCCFDRAMGEVEQRRQMRTTLAESMRSHIVGVLIMYKL